MWKSLEIFSNTCRSIFIQHICRMIFHLTIQKIGQVCMCCTHLCTNVCICTNMKSLYSKVSWQQRRFWISLFVIREGGCDFPGCHCTSAGKELELGTVFRWLQLNVPALGAKPIFLSNGKGLLLVLVLLLFIFVSKLFIVWFQMGTVWDEFYSFLLLFEKYLVSIFLVLGGVLNLRSSGTSRAASDLALNSRNLCYWKK